MAAASRRALAKLVPSTKVTRSEIDTKIAEADGRRAAKWQPRYRGLRSQRREPWQQPLVGLWQQVVRRSLPSPPPPMMEQPPPLRDGESRLDQSSRAGSRKERARLKSKFSYDAAAKVQAADTRRAAFLAEKASSAAAFNEHAAAVCAARSAPEGR